MMNSPVASFLLALTAVTSLYALFQDEALQRALMMHPYSVVRQRRYHTLITSGFVHADIGHLLFNMITFYFFAFPLEQFMGHGRFLALYVVALVLSDVPTVIRKRDDPSYFSLGASGAVTAALFSCIVYQPQARIFLMMIPIGIPAPLFAVAYIAFSIYAARNPRSHINHEAHLWGAVTGLLMTLILDPAAYRNVAALFAG